VAGEPDRIPAQLSAPVVEDGFEPAGTGEQDRLPALQRAPRLSAPQRASYGEYLVTIRVSIVSGTLG